MNYLSTCGTLLSLDGRTRLLPTQVMRSCKRSPLHERRVSTCRALARSATAVAGSQKVHHNRNWLQYCTMEMTTVQDVVRALNPCRPRTTIKTEYASRQQASHLRTYQLHLSINRLLHLSGSFQCKAGRRVLHWPRGRRNKSNFAITPLGRRRKSKRGEPLPAVPMDPRLTLVTLVDAILPWHLCYDQCSRVIQLHTLKHDQKRAFALQQCISPVYSEAP